MKIKTTTTLFCTLVLAIPFAAAVHAAPADVDETGVSWWWGEPTGGTAKIVRTNNGISGSFSSSLANSVGSADGLAVTLWLIIFNNPDECATTPCSEYDLFNPAVMPDAIYGAGNIIDDSEVASFGFSLQAGDNSGSIADLFGMPTDDGDSFGLINPRGAEVHYVLRLHGPMIPLEMPAQIKTYGGGCVDFAPYGYPPPADESELKLGWGECQDVQAALNLTSGSGNGNVDLIGLGALDTGPDEIMSLFSIDTSTGESTLIGSTGIAGLQGLAVNPLTGDVFTTGGYDDASAAGLYQIDPTTGTASYIGGTGNFVALDFSPDGVLYGVGALGNTDDGVADDLYTIDLETGLATRVVFLGAFCCAGIAFSPDGSQIVYTWGGTQVSTIDPSVGTLTFISAVGGGNVQRIATSPNGTIYNANYPTSGAARLYTLDISVPANVTLVGDTGVYFTGLAFK